MPRGSADERTPESVVAVTRSLAAAGRIAGNPGCGDPGRWRGARHTHHTRRMGCRTRRTRHRPDPCHWRDDGLDWCDAAHQGPERSPAPGFAKPAPRPRRPVIALVARSDPGPG